MKHLIVLTVMINCIFLTSCSTKNEHIKTAETFTKNLMSGQIEEAKKYVSESTARELDFANFLGNGFVSPNFEFSFIKDSIHKNESWVKFKNLDDDTIDVIYLIKINDKWLVHLDPKKIKAFK